MVLALAATSGLTRTIAEHEHTVWRAKDGLGGAVIWVDRVPNGMLLLRTSTGYQVFDGVEFHPVGPDTPQPFADLPNSLGQRSRTGAIYFVDPRKQQLMRAWNGLVEPVADKENSTRLTTRFVFDHQGAGWMPALTQMFRLEGLRVEVVDASWGLPPQTRLSNTEVDPRGTLWVGTWTSDDEPGALYYLPKGARRFERFAEPVFCVPLAIAPDGSPWCASEHGLVAITLDDSGRPVGQRTLSPSAHGSMAFDRRGGFWSSSLGRIVHVSDWRGLLEPGGAAALQADVITTKEGLSSDAIWSLMEDADGNIWVGTATGLERFRATRFTPVKLPRRDFGSAILADKDGSLWVGNWDRSLMRLRDGRIEEIPPVTHVTGIRRDLGGNIWVGGQEGIWRKGPEGAFARIASPPASSLPMVHEFAEDDSGAIWLQAGRRLHRLKDGQWSKPEGPGIPPSITFYSIVSDQQKRLWFFGDKSGPFVLEGGVFRHIKPPGYNDNVKSTYCAFVRGSRLFVGHATGMAIFEGDTFYPLKLKGDIAKRISGIVATAEGDVWLHGLAKAFRIPADQVESGMKGQLIEPEVFDFNDGLRAATSTIEPKPTMVEDAAGRLWFSTNQGLYWIDPRVKPAPAAPSQPALIQSVTVDGRVHPTGAEAILPANPGHVEFKYASAALGASERVRFRYRLEGVDLEWKDAGTRRTAYYTQLAPGKYRFEVVASNEQGRWPETPASLALEIQPAWYQTIWFRALIALLCLGLLWSMYLLRVGVVAARERSRTRAISAERERIARDLHDTLLQSMQGLILGFQGLTTGLPAQDGTRRTIETQLDRADQLLGEARDRVRDLRTTGNDAMSLREAFEVVATELADLCRVDVKEVGTPRAMAPEARDGIYLVGREATLNAATHGQGRVVQVQMQYGRDQFVLRVRDDGIGIDHEVLAAGARPGHFGLIGMRERASVLGADLDVANLADKGTEVKLAVPSKLAYAPVGGAAAFLDRFKRRFPGSRGTRRG